MSVNNASNKKSGGEHMSKDVRVKFRFLKETKNKYRYDEIKSEDMSEKVGSFYVDKKVLGAPLEEIEITIHVPGEK